MSCNLCQHTQFQTVYHGPIRMGRFGEESPQPHTLQRCLGCGVIALPNLVGELSTYYETGAYRQAVDGGQGLDHFQALHDAEQPRHLRITGMERLRNKVVADIGCGAGAFLDVVRGLAQQLIAVEPNQAFRESLSHRGFATFDYASQAEPWTERVDTVTCFSVLEHIEQPLPFLQDLRRLLKPGGQLVLTTPNAQDYLLSILPQAFGAFFYRQAHLWYWDAQSLTWLLEKAGFKQVVVQHDHRYGMSNFLNWVHLQRPKGNTRLPYISETLDEVWRLERERTQTSDYLTAYATV